MLRSDSSWAMEDANVDDDRSARTFDAAAVALALPADGAASLRDIEMTQSTLSSGIAQPMVVS